MHLLTVVGSATKVGLFHQARALTNSSEAREISSDSFKCVTSHEIVLLLVVIRVMTLKRFGVSIPEDLLDKFDELVKRKGYIGRSEAIRDAMREYISQFDWSAESDQETTMASLNIVYQHKPKLMADLMRVQHDAHAQVISTVHIHATHSHCIEVITLKGPKKDIEEFADKVSGLKGIEYVRLFTFFLPESDDVDHSHSH
jgi:CopG family nickel-responsive transcriptional regulator